jgi:hypothetical protein
MYSVVENDLAMGRKFKKFNELYHKLSIDKPNSKAKLTFSKVEEMMIKVYNREFQTKVEIAKYYKVHYSTIDQIFRGESWRRVTDKLQIPIKELAKYITPKNQTR